MCFNIVVAQMLGAPLGDKSRLILCEYTFFVSLFGKHPLVVYGYGTGSFVN